MRQSTKTHHMHSPSHRWYIIVHEFEGTFFAPYCYVLRSRCGKGVIGIAQVVSAKFCDELLNIAILSTRLDSACAKDKILPAEI